MFDKYYSENTKELVEDAYNNVSLQPTVKKYIKTYVEAMIDKYLNDTFDTSEAGLKDVIDDIMENDVPGYIRDEYAAGGAIKTKIDTLIESNASRVIDDYKNNTLTAAEKALIDEEIKKYANKIADSYVDGSIDATTKNFIDNAIDDYIEGVINDFINDVNRDDVRELITEYADKAIEAYKDTQAYKDLINIFKNEEDYIKINKDNVSMIRAIATAVSAYDFNKINNDFLIPHFGDAYVKLVDLVGKSYIEGYVNDAITSFANGLKEQCDRVDEDVANGNTTSVYEYPAALSTTVNYIGDVLYHFYDRAMNKVVNKAQSMDVFKYSENTYLQNLLNRNLLDDIFFNGDISQASGNKSGYKFKNGFIDYYNGVLNELILAHDAFVWYGTLSDAQIMDVLTRYAEITAKFANKANDIVMDFIENEELPRGWTLDKLLDVNHRIESLYNTYEEQINKLLDLYAEYLDRDYSVLPGHVDVQITDGEDFYTVFKILLENADPAFTVNSAFGTLFDANYFTKYPKAQKVVDKIQSYKYVPEYSQYRYNIDAYKGTVSSKTVRGIETGNITVDLRRYLAR